MRSITQDPNNTFILLYSTSGFHENNKSDPNQQRPAPHREGKAVALLVLHIAAVVEVFSQRHIISQICFIPANAFH